MHWVNVIYNGQQLTKLLCVAQETVIQSYTLDIFVVLLLIFIHTYTGCHCNVIIKLRVLCASFHIMQIISYVSNTFLIHF